MTDEEAFHAFLSGLLAAPTWSTLGPTCKEIWRLAPSPWPNSLEVYRGGDGAKIRQAKDPNFVFKNQKKGNVAIRSFGGARLGGLDLKWSLGSRKWAA